jgi:DnaJ-class molecular chaperone
MEAGVDKQARPIDAKTAAQAAASSDQQQPVMAPGDQAPPGTPGTGDNVCPTCNGSGRAQGAACPTCRGTGTVVEAIGGGG